MDLKKKKQRKGLWRSTFAISSNFINAYQTASKFDIIKALFIHHF